MSNSQSPARSATEEALVEAQSSLLARDFDRAWPALERAHILSQPDPGLHVRSHWWMLRCAVRQRDLREVAGQAVRLLLAAPGSWLDRYPRGNTGRARISMFQPMPIPANLEKLLKDEPV